MKNVRKLVAVASAVALALTLTAPAFADDRTGDMTAGNEQETTDANGNKVGSKEYSGAIEPGDSFNADTVITADVKAPTAKVISVTLPSTMSIAVGTKYANVGGAQTAVYDASTTHAVAAAVKNASKGTAVDVSVATVAETPAGALATLLLKLTPASSSATSVATAGVDLLTSTADAPLVTGLAGLAEDGTGTAGEATLSLSTGMTDNTTALDSLAGKKVTVTTTLKVAVPATTPAP